MSELPGSDPSIEAPRRFIGSLSLVWLIPVAAIVFAAWVMYQNWHNRGELISIRFAAAGGVKAGETVVRRNDVEVGRVEAVELSDDIDSVIIKVRMSPKVDDFIDENARFWIVNARFTTTEISGLSTLLSGSYIEADFDDEAGEEQYFFEGLEEAPLVRRSEPGLRLTLRAEEAGYIYPGSPVYIRQIEVGRVERRRLSGDGREVLIDIFVRAPHHEYVYPHSKFFSVSGVEARLDPDGAMVRVESLSAFFTGGVGIDNPPETLGEEPLQEQALIDSGKIFKLYESRSAAADSLADEVDDPFYRVIVRFSGSVKGLRRDAPVEFNGLRVGRVLSVAAGLPDGPGSTPEAVVVLQLHPQRMGLAESEQDSFLNTLDELVASGMRAQLASGNLLTGALLVKLVMKPELAMAELDRSSQPYPALPSLKSNVEAVTADVETIIAKIADLPLDALLEEANLLLSDTRALIGSPAVAGLPDQLSASLASLATTANRVEVASRQLPTMLNALTSASKNADDVLSGLSPDSEIYVELSAAARELRRAARSIAAFADYLEDNPNAIITGR